MSDGFASPGDQCENSTEEKAALEFVVLFEDEGGDAGNEDATEGAAGGDQEIECGKAFGRGAETIEFAMTNHGANEKADAVGGQLFVDGGVFAFGQSPADGGEGTEQQQHIRKAHIPARAVKADDEAQEIKGQRQNPEEGDDGDVLADFVGGGEEEDGSAGGEEEPKEIIEG